MSDTSNIDQQIADAIAAAANIDPAAGANELLPTPIGVPKYRVDENGEIVKDASGKPVPWYAQVPEGRQVDTPTGVTGRIDPGSMAAETGRQVHPKYWQHDAWTLIDAMSPEDVYGVQRQLIDSGLLKPKGVVAGNWTNKEAGAFTQVLSAANQSGTTWDVALSHMAANGRLNPPEETKVQRPAIEVHKANPFALGQVADKLSAQLIGRRLTDAERNNFVEWWGQKEDAANAELSKIAGDEANDTMTSGGDLVPGSPRDIGHADDEMSDAALVDTPATQRVGVATHTIHDEMTPDQAAEQFIRERHAGEVSQTQQMSTFSQFLDILGTGMGGGVPGRPGA